MNAAILTNRFAPKRVARGSHKNRSSWEWPKAALLAAALTAVLLIDVIEYATGQRIHLEPFYVFPVGLVAWRLGRAEAVGLGALTAVTWLVSDGLTGTVEWSWVSVWNAMVRVVFFGVVADVLVRLRRALHEARRLSTRDSLTGVLNRAAFRDALAAEVGRSRRYARPISVAFIDVDDFKRVNDRYGHVAGDRVLQDLTSVLCANLRSVDVLGRLGGDEFGVILPETAPPDARNAMEKVRRKLEEAAERGMIRVSVSVGIVGFDQPPPDADTILSRADALMYMAKATGKNAVVGVDTALTDEASA